jgi:hypothetical protein
MEGVAAFVNAVGQNALRATVLLLVALLLALVLRRSAAALRHALWAGAITALLLLPLAGALAPPLALPWLAPPQARVIGPLSYGPPVAERAPWLPPEGVPVAPPLPRLEIPGERLQVEGAPALPPRREWLPGALGAVWLLGAVTVLVRSARGRWRAGRLLDGTALADAAIWPGPAGVEVREGEAIELPMTVGALRPVILVPSVEGRRWPLPWRAAVIRHEAAHVRRRDPLWQALAELTCALYWFHPLVWLAARQLRTERELAADDEVLSGELRPSEYAEVLITLGCLPAAPPASGAVLPLLTPAGLKARLLGIIDEGRRRTVGLGTRAALAALGSVLFVPAAGAVLVARGADGRLGPGVPLACAREEATGRPVAGAEADVWDGMGLAQRVTTARDGCLRWYRETPHWSSQLVVYARRGALAGRKAIWPVEGGTVLPATVELRPALSVSGTISDAGGRPLPGALVRVVWSQSWARGPGPDAFALSGPDGRFRFEGLLYGSYRLYFEGPAGGVATELVELDQASVTGLAVRIPTTPPVTGYLRTESHQPVAGARVEDVPFVSGPEPGLRLRGRHVEWDVSGADGGFRVAFIGRALRATGRDEAGRLISAVFPDWDRRPSPVHPGAWDAGRPAEARIVIMRPAGVIRGTVRFADGKPVPGTSVAGMVLGEVRNAIPTDTSVRTSADEQGRFVVGPFPLGDVDLRSMAGPRSDPPYHMWADRRRVKVTGEKDPPLDVVLQWLPETALTSPP